MKKSILILIALLGFAPLAWAGPGEGWGFFLENVSQNVKNADSGLVYAKPSAGGMIDYQWGGDSFTWGLMVSEVGGSASFPNDDTLKWVKTDLLAAKFTFWLSNFYLGVHYGVQSLVWAESASSFDFKTAGASGYGLGYEAESGWHIGYARDSSGRIQFDDLPDQTVSGSRWFLGYRWR